MRTYVAIAERSGDWWAISVPELPGVFTQAKTLERGEAMAREAIALMVDVPAHMVEVKLETEVPAAAHELDDLRLARRRRAEASEREAVNLVKAAQRLTSVMSVRDAGKVLGVSYQRVSQLSRTRLPAVGEKSARRRTTT
ncbi:HicB-like antitoxin of HicAB toxin-antitoxin system [Stackebrandtia albiflava]|uniref:HicB-like antitoxin of HicAB toxin-antitoxin system n=1 Tax=Stackebrandtia albiflava TaxID=406432 RepID=A0A562UR21_9ACTN|nr:type II toxin-antitoxin system HicB family antitoxin [Stackebrandtia albiflava]TWJ08073.1 HicB-like antitoxin of HicAB toxin-antitoxin system [Stackebrandtia albiflava]